VLTRQGVTGWRRALARIAPESSTRHPAAVASAGAVPAPIAAELIDALATLTLAGI